MPRATLLLFCLTLLCAPVVTLPAVTAAEKASKKQEEEIRKLPVPPPQPVAQEVAVKRGEQIDIKLSIYGRKNENLRYLIRKPPEQGKLTEPKVVSQESSVVTYKPPADLTITRDRFLYAVQNTAGVSAAVEVNIKIVDDPAQLIVPDMVELGPILAGSATFKEMEIANIGGGVSEGEVKVPAPWRIEGPTTYKLAAGARHKLLLFFEPKAGGIFRGEIRYTSQLDHSTVIVGRSEAAISTEPSELTLQSPEGETKRSGYVEIANNTGAEQEVTLKSGGRLKFPPTVKIPAGGKNGVTVLTGETDTAPLDEQILLSGAGIEVKVPVRAPAVGAVLRVNTAVVQFPLVRRGQPVSTSVIVENGGGSPGFWKAEAEPPFAAEPASLRLPAGEKREVRVSLLADDTGPLRGWLRFTGEAQTREVRLEAEVISARTLAAPPSGSSSANAAPRRTESSGKSGAGTNGEGEEDAAAAERFQTLMFYRDNVSVTHVTPTAATVEWPASLANAKSFRLETRNVAMDDQGHLRTSWHQPSAVQFKENAGRFYAEMRDLRPSTRLTVRVLPIAEGGQQGSPLFITQFETAPPKRGGGRITPFSVGVFLLSMVAVGGFVWQKLRARNQEA